MSVNTSSKKGNSFDVHSSNKILTIKQQFTKQAPTMWRQSRYFILTWRFKDLSGCISWHCRSPAFWRDIASTSLEWTRRHVWIPCNYARKIIVGCLLSSHKHVNLFLVSSLNPLSLYLVLSAFFPSTPTTQCNAVPHTDLGTDYTHFMRCARQHWYRSSLASRPLCWQCSVYSLEVRRISCKWVLSYVPIIVLVSKGLPGIRNRHSQHISHWHKRLQHNFLDRLRLQHLRIYLGQCNQ